MFINLTPNLVLDKKKSQILDLIKNKKVDGVKIKAHVCIFVEDILNLIGSES